jgi:SMI1-KNR4 cell-wall
MSMNLLEANNPTTRAAIAECANKFGVVLPKEYESFLIDNNGGRPTQSRFPIVGLEDNTYGNVQFFFGIGAALEVYDLCAVNEFYRGLPHGIVLIACTAGSD